MKQSLRRILASIVLWGVSAGAANAQLCRMFLEADDMLPIDSVPGTGITIAQSAGDTFIQYVFVQCAPPGVTIKGAQATMPCGAACANSGSVVYVPPVAIDVTTPLYIYSNLPGSFPATDNGTCPVGRPRIGATSGLGAPVLLTAPRYLGEFIYQVSTDCSGDAVLMVPNEPASQLRDAAGMPVSFTTDGATVVVPTGCPAGSVTFVNPPGGIVDARQPHPINTTTPLQGIQTFTVTAPADVPAECWSLCETPVDGTPNAIQSVTGDGETYTIILARPITPGEVTRISYTDDDQTETTGAFVAHPGNVNGDGFASPLDVLRLIDCLNGVNLSNCPWGVYSTDIDHSGAFGPADILRLIDLLNGADAFDPWNNTPLPSGPC